MDLSSGPLRAHFKKLDWVIIMSAVILTVFGLLEIYSCSLRQGDFSNFQKQIVFFVIGIFLMFLISFFDYRILKNNSYLILILYLICLALLAGVFLFTPMIRGKRGWYKMGPLSFDPIEAMKIVLIIYLRRETVPLSSRSSLRD